MIYSQVEVKIQVVVGDPKYKICETAEKLHADLLVMGSRAYGRIKRYQFRLLYLYLAMLLNQRKLQAFDRG